MALEMELPSRWVWVWVWVSVTAWKWETRSLRALATV